MSRKLPFDRAVGVFMIHKLSVDIIHKQNRSCTSPSARGKVVQAITNHYQSIAFILQVPLFCNVMNSRRIWFRWSEFPCDNWKEYLPLAKVRNKMIDRGTRNKRISSRPASSHK